MKPALHFLLALLIASSSLPAIDLSASGDWAETLNASDLASGAGTDLPSNLQSVSGITVLSVSNVTGAWHVTARRSSSTWDNHFTLYVRRTSSGIGSGSISGGDSYIEVTGTDTEIFSGSGPRSSISIQYKLTGLNHNIPPSRYLSSLIFTAQ